MSVGLADLLARAEAGFAIAALVFLRVGGVMALLPGLGERSVPARVRLALALGFTAIVAPALAGVLAPLALSPRIMLAEAVCGLTLGIALRIAVLALQTAGDIAAQSASLSQILGGAALDPQPAMGRLIVMGGLALAAISGLPVRAAEAMILSYDALPPGRFPVPGLLADWGVGRVARGFAVAVTLAMPFVIAGVIYNIALGVINRAMPQLMVAFVGAPALTLGGLVLLFLAAPGLLEVWRALLLDTLAAPFAATP
ncbi:flagellar biosynthetic protein FliR [Rhodovulum iodosum]|uniref:Flagellar biosynthetic protein FliR n=1 Tax=Rhodovulum iodosum TaxID=68291 RepID=A0ABV3XRH4_9RHOB|nr:flagellar biosynthetic protein FliR [Rhodovulum robiginosum]RSK40028.1 type III secretion protein [Rhodovulum robiginosum]